MVTDVTRKFDRSIPTPLAPMYARLFFILLLLTSLIGTNQIAIAQANESRTILVMGFDRRPDEPIESGVRPDMMAVLHLNAQAEACRLLSIPRDTRVEVPGSGFTKINHAWAIAGAPLILRTVREYLDMPIQEYVAIDMEAVPLIVDAIGGLTIEQPEQFSFGAYTWVSSPQVLSGEAVLAYVRYRDDDDGDFGRVRRQQQVLVSLLNQVSELDLGSLSASLVAELSDHYRSNLGVQDLLELANDWRDICQAHFETDSLSGVAALAWDELNKQELWFVLVDEEEVIRGVSWLLGTG